MAMAISMTIAMTTADRLYLTFTTRITSQTLPTGWYNLTVNRDNAFGSRIFFV